jgi:hypothetical protein
LWTTRGGAAVEQVENFKFFGVQITKNLKMVNMHIHSCEEVATAPLPPQEVERLGMDLQKGFTAVPLRESWLHHCLV